MFLPGALLIFFGIDFLPSPDWVVSSANWIPIMGIVFAPLGALFLELERRSSSKKHHWLVLLAFLYPLGLLVGFVTAYLFITATLPAVASALVREPVSYSYGVRNPKVEDRRRCKNGVGLSDVSVTFAKICSVDDQVRDSLSAGGEVVARGFGSKHGVFYETLEW